MFADLLTALPPTCTSALLRADGSFDNTSVSMTASTKISKTRKRPRDALLPALTNIVENTYNDSSAMTTRAIKAEDIVDIKASDDGNVKDVEASVKGETFTINADSLLTTLTTTTASDTTTCSSHDTDIHSIDVRASHEQWRHNLLHGDIGAEGRSDRGSWEYQMRRKMKKDMINSDTSTSSSLLSTILSNMKTITNASDAKSASYMSIERERRRFLRMMDERRKVRC